MHYFPCTKPDDTLPEYTRSEYAAADEAAAPPASPVDPSYLTYLDVLDLLKIPLSAQDYNTGNFKPSSRLGILPRPRLLPRPLPLKEWANRGSALSPTLALSLALPLKEWAKRVIFFLYWAGFAYPDPMTRSG
jgi:hypothetical protein